MKKGICFLTLMLTMTLIESCSKSDVNGDSDSNCYECSTATESIDVCEEGGKFVVDGETIDNPNDVSLQDFIRAIELNPNDDPDLDGIRCNRK
ncbi:MAG: hypothetical protein ABJN95_17130 [Maribacter sp.]|uniref:hypothetical protein n=1 Tax=Maribacter sp. TaxID=1897614 RepID=UPI0032994357